jgi:lysophospholipase L1-like esterase
MARPFITTRFTMIGMRRVGHLLAGTLVLAGLLGVPGELQAQLRIMPLGDSITVGVGSPDLGGYRVPLWKIFVADEWGAVFVGSQESGPPLLGSKNNEGHGGWRIDQIDAEVGQWLADSPADVILLMIGTNDCLQNYQFGTVQQRMERLIDHILQARPEAYLVISTVLPIANSAANARAQHINHFLPAVVEARVKMGEPILLLDLASLLDPHKDLVDGIHPNQVGYAKMAEGWLFALEYIVAIGWDLVMKPRLQDDDNSEAF